MVNPVIKVKVRGPQIVADSNKDDDEYVTILIGLLEIIFYAESASDRTQLIKVSIIALLYLRIDHISPLICQGLG